MTKDSREIWISALGVRTEFQGRLAGLVSFRDITERKRAEEALRVSEEKFRSLANDVLDSAAVGMFILDRDFRVVWVNRALQRYFDIRREQALGKDKRELIGERIKHIFEDSETFAQKVLATYDDNTYIENFECHVLPKGRRKERWLEHWSQPIKSGLYAGGRIEHYYDITERKQAEERLTRLSRALEMATDSIVISDINARIIDVNEATLKMYGTADREELVGKSSFALIAPEDHERALASLKQTLEKGYIEGQEYHAITEHGIRILAETNCGIMKDAHGKVTGFVATSRDITERKQAEERLRQSWEQLRRVLEETVDALASLVEKRDPYTAGHQQRVTKLACAIAEEMGLPEEQIKGIRVAGTIHDVGKIYVPAEILSKPGKLTDYEFAIIKTHPQVGYEIVEGIEFPWPVAQAVLQHHERLDGSGYPAGLSGEEIILEARILAVSDVVEAMSSHRPFRPALGTDKALEEISRNRGVLYDPDVVNACLKLFNEKGFRFE